LPRSHPHRRGLGRSPSAVADLVVVLEKIDEGGQGKTKNRLAARFAAAVSEIALIDKARAKGAGDVTKRGALIVAVVALRFAGQPYVPGVVIVVVPLRSIIAAWRVLSGSSMLTQLASFSSTRWMWRPLRAQIHRPRR
jgi:hypothetical protein